MVCLGLGTAIKTPNLHGLYSAYRDKLVGWSPVRTLLKGANQVTSADKYTRRFRKSGNYESAVKDFNAAHPTDVSRLTLPNGNEGVFGNAGERLIMLEKKGEEGKPTMRIMKFFGIGKNVEDKIVYTDKIIYDSAPRKTLW